MRHHRSSRRANLTNTFRALARTPYVAAAVVYKLQDSAAEEFGVLTERRAQAGVRARSPVCWPRRSAASAGVTLEPATPAESRGRERLRAGRGLHGAGSLPGQPPALPGLFTLDRFNRYSLALPSVLGTSGLRVRVYQYWAGLAAPARQRPEAEPA